jgi:GAF domain-containing protein
MNNLKETKDSAILDKERLEEIGRLDLDSNEVREILDRYVSKASGEFDLPIGLVSIVLDGAQIFASSKGLQGWIAETNGTPVEWSFCANSVESRKPFVVENATLDDRVKDNPLVAAEGLRCYAGAPMITSRGHVIGNFCVMGPEKRTFSSEEIAKLSDYAKKAILSIEEQVN